MSVFDPRIHNFLSVIIYLTTRCISDSVHFSFIRSFSSSAILLFVHLFHSHINLPISPRAIHPSTLHLRICGSIHSIHVLFFTWLSPLTLPLTQSATHNWSIHRLLPIFAPYLPKAHLSFNLTSPSWCTQYPFLRHLPTNTLHLVIFIITSFTINTIYFDFQRTVRRDVVL